MEKIYKSKNRMMVILFIISMILYTFTTNAEELCSGTDIQNGAISIDLSFPPPSPNNTNFVAGLVGTIDRVGPVKVVGGIDWLYSDVGEFSTTSMGGQLIAWWTLKDSRNTVLQVTNQSLTSSVSLHISIHDENCNEIRDFCDLFTPGDTHPYDLSNIVKNSGSPVPSADLEGKEGFITVTPTVDCLSDFRAISFPFLHGNMKINHPKNKYKYEFGTKMWARDTDTLSYCTETTGLGFQVLTGAGDCGFEPVLPSNLSHVFSVQSDSNASRADIVLISFEDFYDSPSGAYQASPGSVLIEPNIIDQIEITQSCPTRIACFLRVGINDILQNSDTALPDLRRPPFDPPGPPDIPGPPGRP